MSMVAPLSIQKSSSCLRPKCTAWLGLTSTALQAPSAAARPVPMNRPVLRVRLIPFSSRKAAELKGLLKEFDFLRTVKLRDGFALYVGRGPDEESALKLKVRLAEEYGINGRIVRISGDGDRSYIYGE